MSNWTAGRQAVCKQQRLTPSTYLASRFTVKRHEGRCSFGVIKSVSRSGLVRSGVAPPDGRARGSALVLSPMVPGHQRRRCSCHVTLGDSRQHVSVNTSCATSEAHPLLHIGSRLSPRLHKHRHQFVAVTLGTEYYACTAKDDQYQSSGGVPIQSRLTLSHPTDHHHELRSTSMVRPRSDMVLCVPSRRGHTVFRAMYTT